MAVDLETTGHMHERRPFSSGLMSCITPILIASLIMKPTHYRPALFLPVLGISYYLLYYTTTGNAVTDLSIGDAITPLVATAFDFIILNEPQTQLFKLGQTIPSSTFPSIRQKILWALDLLSSHRGIGWTHEPTDKLPAAPFANGASRPRFIAHQLFTIACHFLMWDVCAIYARSTPAFSINGPALATRPLFWKCVNVWAWAIPAAAALTISHSLVSIVFVSLGIWSIPQWRPLFGSWKDAYTIRRFWSRTWHQCLRRAVTSPGQKLRNILSISKGTNASSYIILYTSFFVSAWIHHPGDYMMLGRYGGSLKFFISQALIITVEDGVIALGKKLGFVEERKWRILGYIWGQIWFAHLLPLMIEPQVKAGLMENGMGFSVILGLWEGNWTPKYE